MHNGEQKELSTLQILQAVCRKISNILIRDFNEIEQLQSKHTNVKTFVQKSISRANGIALRFLQETKPTFSVELENGIAYMPSEQEEGRFLVKAVDGQRCFYNSLPYFSIALAAQMKTDQGMLTNISLVCLPIQNEIFTAVKGGGNYLNEQRSTCSNVGSLTDSEVAIVDFDHKDIETLYNKGISFSTVESFSLAASYVSCGKYKALCAKNASQFNLKLITPIINESACVVYKVKDKTIVANRTLCEKIKPILA